MCYHERIETDTSALAVVAAPADSLWISTHSASPRGVVTLKWRHNERNGISNHQRLHRLLNCWFRRRSKKTSKLRVTGLVQGIHLWPVISPHKRPVTRKMLPFDDVIMKFTGCWWGTKSYNDWGNLIMIGLKRKQYVASLRQRNVLFYLSIFFQYENISHYRLILLKKSDDITNIRIGLLTCFWL